VFNIQGSEMIFLLLVALIILGPEKLPDAIRKFGRAYSEFKKMANGFQGEIRQALDEPMRELKDTADMMRSAVNFGDDAAPEAPPAVDPTPPPEPIKREQGLNFGSANPRRTPEATADAGAAADAAPVVREPGLNFGSANPRPTAASTNGVVDGTDEPAAAPAVQIRKGPRSVRDPLAGLEQGGTAAPEPAAALDTATTHDATAAAANAAVVEAETAE
jgi:sec-independent protein translocase protein TatB